MNKEKLSEIEKKMRGVYLKFFCTKNTRFVVYNNWTTFDLKLSKIYLNTFLSTSPEENLRREIDNKSILFIYGD